MKKVFFKADFEQRLVRLYKVLGVYLVEGRDCGLASALFSVVSAIWTFDRVRLSDPKSKDSGILSINVYSDEDLPF